MNLTGETQPLVEQLMMVKRMQVGRGWVLCPPPRAGHGSRREESSGLSGTQGLSCFVRIMDPRWWFCLVEWLCCLHLPSQALAQESGRCLCCLALTCRIPKGQETGVGWAPSSSSPLVLPTAYPTPLFVLEIWKACFVGLIESPEGTGELKWTAFTFLKVPGLWEPQRATVGMVLRRGGNPWTFTPRFSPLQLHA